MFTIIKFLINDKLEYMRLHNINEIIKISYYIYDYLY